MLLAIIFGYFSQYFNIHRQQSMLKHRIAWTNEEDRILKYLRQVKGIKRWKEISKTLQTEYLIEGRNQKQCRDRYQNYLKTAKDKNKWDEEDEEKLMSLHNKYGNKWALISKHYPDRTGSFIKNKFYANLRKGLRKLNQIIQSEFQKEFDEIELNIIFKISKLNGNDKANKTDKEKDKTKDKSMQQEKDSEDNLIFLGKILFDECMNAIDVLNEILQISSQKYVQKIDNEEQRSEIKKVIKSLKQIEKMTINHDGAQDKEMVDDQFSQSEYVSKRNCTSRKLKVSTKRAKKNGYFDSLEDGDFISDENSDSSDNSGPQLDYRRKKSKRKTILKTVPIETNKSSEVIVQVIPFSQNNQNLEPLMCFVEEQQFTYNEKHFEKSQMREINLDSQLNSVDERGLIDYYMNEEKDPIYANNSENQNDQERVSISLNFESSQNNIMHIPEIFQINNRGFLLDSLLDSGEAACRSQ